MKSNIEPKVTVVTICYNEEKRIDQTCKSVVYQTYKNIEWIIVDGKSTDNTLKIINDYKHKVTKLISEKDKGRYDGMNKGIKNSTGEYLIFLNGGDYFFDKDSISNLVKGSNNSDIVSGNIVVVEKKNKHIFSPPDNISFKFFLSSALPHQATLIKKKLFKAIGLYDTTMKISADHKFFANAISNHQYSYIHINKTISFYHCDGVSSDPKLSLDLQEEKYNYFTNDFSVETTKLVNKSISRKENYKTAILFIIFNRPKNTKTVFEQIKKIKPSRLYVVADGPRDKVIDETSLCAKTRSIIKEINWNCQLKTLFRKHNFGCGNSISQGITWFFKNEAEGIILEDDCVPDISFFTYCSNLLEKYRNDTRITHINGLSYIKSPLENNDSYYYSKYFHVWGWATWKRAWEKYDFTIRSLPNFLSAGSIKHIFIEPQLQAFWENYFTQVHNNEIDTWDYQWVYTNFAYGGLSIMPFKNMIKNIGFGPDSTHTTDANETIKKTKSQDMGLIHHPEFFVQNHELDLNIYKDTLGINFENSKINIKNNQNTIPTYTENRLIMLYRRIKYFLIPENSLRFKLLSKLKSEY